MESDRLNSRQRVSTAKRVDIWISIENAEIQRQTNRKTHTR